MILAFAGGVGGAKLANGLARALSPDDLLIAVNTGDDFKHLGLHISPDLDSVTYSLAGINNLETGWGRADETWTFMAALAALGGPTWFKLGDADLAMHVERTHRLASGVSLSAATRELSSRLGIRHRIVPMSDHAVSTMIETGDECIAFQDYFVRLRCEPVVEGFRFEGVESALPAADIQEALGNPRLQAIVICPSNPFVSIAPILAVTKLSEWHTSRAIPIVAVSPIVANKAVKGPALKMMLELGHEASALGVARIYGKLLDGFVIDRLDAALTPKIEALGMRVLVTDTIMLNAADQQNLARAVLGFTSELSRG